MTEEVKQETQEGQEQVQEPQYSEIEREAMQHGWRPKDQFDESSGKKWRSAEEFMDRKPLFDKIDEQHKRLRDLENGVKALAEHNKRIEEAAYQRAMRELRAERKQALEDGDLVKAEEIRDRIDEVKEQQRKQPAPQQASNPQFDAWVAENKWYNEDPKLRKFADGVALDLRNQGVNDPVTFLKSIEREVRETFPDKFRNPNRDLAPKLDSGKGSSKPDTFQISADDERIIDRMIKAGVGITREEYIAQLRKARGVK